MKIIGLFGAVGSGKSSQGQALASRAGWSWISTGELLRGSGDEQILAQLFTSRLIDDRYVTGVLTAALEKAEKEGVKVVVLDGYPRTAEQVGMMKESGLAMELGLVIEIDFAEAWRRIVMRGRNTDEEGVVKERFEVYEQNMCSIRKLLEEQGTKFVDIDGLGTVEEVGKRIEQVLENGGLV